MKKGIIAVILVVSLVAFMALKIKVDTISREKIPGSSIIYLPSGKYLKYATFGYSSLIADSDILATLLPSVWGVVKL